MWHGRGQGRMYHPYSAVQGSLRRGLKVSERASQRSVGKPCLVQHSMRSSTIGWYSFGKPACSSHKTPQALYHFFSIC